MSASDYKRLGSSSRRPLIVTAANEKRFTDRMLFDSQSERRAYEWLKPQLRPGQKLVVHARLPLIALQPTFGRVASYMTVDLVIFEGLWVRMELPQGAASTCVSLPVRAVDAKPQGGYETPAWRTRAAAFRATYGCEIEIWREAK